MTPGELVGARRTAPEGPFPEGTRRAGRRRRPTGEAPPLPRHLETTGIGWLVTALVLLLLALGLLMADRYGRGVALTVADTRVLGWLAGLREATGTGVMRVLAGIGAWQVAKVFGIAAFITLIVVKRFRHLLVMWLSINAVLLVAIGLSAMVRRPRPLGVEQAGAWSGFAMPSRSVAILSAFLICAIYALIPKGRWRQLAKAAVAVVIAVVAVARMALGLDSPSDVLLGVAIGVTIPLVAFRLLCPDAVFPVVYKRGRSAHLDVTGARGAAIRKALVDQLGLTVTEVKPFNLAGSAGSTPLRITVEGSGGDTHLFGKLYARNHLRADRWYKLGRELMYGRLEDEKSFSTVRRLVQQEDYALHKLHALGLPVPRPHGFVELTPDREYLLVTEFFEGSVELGEADIDDQIIDQGLEIIRRLWDAGLAHRDIKPANLLVRDGRLLLIDVSFVEVRPTPWRQAVDLANMMLCLALRSDARTVYELARRRFTVEEISEGFAAARGLALPSQLRKLIRDQGRDLHAEFIDLLPERPAPISIQRWSARRVVVVVLAAVAVLLGASSFIDLVGYNDRLNTSLEARPSCGSLEPLWLIAQSVPSASRVPCVPALPAGVVLSDVRVGNEGTRLSFSRFLADGSSKEQALTSTFAAGCDVTGSTRTLTDEAGVQRWERTEPGAGGRTVVLRSYVFPGGCLSERYLPPAGRPGPPVDEAMLAVDLTTREALGQALDQRSGGRLRLDP